MAAPDLPAPPPYPTVERALHVHLHVRLVSPERLAGGVVVVIDALRASVTIAAALAAGAPFVVPALTVEDARERARELNAQSPSLGSFLRERGVALGGERGGIKIEGFDFDNSPSAYAREAIAGRALVFTTTNGTAALLHAGLAARAIVGSFANLSAVCDAVADDPRDVHILCCGTRHEISLDDILPAGAFVERLVARGRSLTADDGGRTALLAWRGANASPGGLVEAMRQSRGGRNLERVGLGADVEFCSRIDSIPVVPEFDVATGRIVPTNDNTPSRP